MQIPRPLFVIARSVIRLYWRVRRPITAGVRALVWDDQGRVLLVRHTYMPGWFLPGGGVERGETMAEALVRELHEEVGLTVQGPGRLIGLFANFREFKSDHVALYEVLQFALPPRPQWRRNIEIAEFDFFSPALLPDGTSEATRRRIMEAQEGHAAPEMW